MLEGDITTENPPKITQLRRISRKQPIRQLAVQLPPPPDDIIDKLSKSYLKRAWSVELKVLLYNIWYFICVYFCFCLNAPLLASAAV